MNNFSEETSFTVSTADGCDAADRNNIKDFCSADGTCSGTGTGTCSGTGTYSFTDAYSAAKELAESYADLLKQKESYSSRMGEFPHYTLNDAYYLLTEGARAQAERVRNTTISDPTACAAEKAEKLMNRLNRELDAEYQAKVVDPYLDICEKLSLFETCMNLLDRRQRHIADQLYVQKRPKYSIVDQNGDHVSRIRLEYEINAILEKFAWVLSEYNKFRGPDKKRLMV